MVGFIVFLVIYLAGSACLLRGIYDSTDRIIESKTDRKLIALILSLAWPVTMAVFFSAVLWDYFLESE